MTLLQITFETSRHITESTAIEWLIGLLGALMSLIATYSAIVIRKNSKSTERLADAMTKVEIALGIKSQKIDDIASSCITTHENINNRFDKSEKKQDYYERVQASHNLRIFRTEQKLNLDPLIEEKS